MIDEAITLARKVVEEKNPELSEVRKRTVAQMVGMALKFAVLIQNRETNITFTWEKMRLSLEGETRPMCSTRMQGRKVF